MGEGYIEEDYSVPQRWVWSECYLKCESPKVNVIRGRLIKGCGMIRSYICSTQKYEMVLKLERLSNLLDRSFGLDYPIGVEALSLRGALNESTKHRWYLSLRNSPTY